MSAPLAHLTAEQRERFRSRRMKSAELLAVHEHLRACDACAKQWEITMSSRSTLPLIQEWIVGEHPSEERLAAYVDEVLEQWERLEIEAHVEGCNTCLETLHDFRDLRLQIASPRSRMNWYAIAAAVIVAVIGGVALFVQRPAAPDRVVGIAPSPLPPPSHPVTAALDPVVTQVLTEGRIAPPPKLAELLQGGGVDVARGTSGATAMDSVAPDRVVVSSTRPQFRWHREKGERSVVRVFHGSEEAGHSAELAGEEWRPDFDLVRGDTYAWQVELTIDGKTRVVPAPPQPPAMFIVLDEAEWKDLENARAVEPADHLRIGVLAARAGLREEAEAELLKASQQPGADPRIVPLFRSLRQWEK